MLAVYQPACPDLACLPRIRCGRRFCFANCKNKGRESEGERKRNGSSTLSRVRRIATEAATFYRRRGEAVERRLPLSSALVSHVVNGVETPIENCFHQVIALDYPTRGSFRATENAPPNNASRPRCVDFACPMRRATRLLHYSPTRVGC